MKVTVDGGRRYGQEDVDLPANATVGDLLSVVQRRCT